MGLQRPESTEHHEFYARYIAHVPDGDIVDILRTEMSRTQALLASIPPDKETYAYAPGKWTVREVVGHLIDVERTFAFRALWFARGGDGELPGLDQDEWAASSNAANRTLAELSIEWAALRKSNTAMFEGFDESAGTRSGVASGFTFTVRAVAFMIAGHELYHRRLLRRDYLGEDV